MLPSYRFLKFEQKSHFLAAKMKKKKKSFTLENVPDSFLNFSSSISLLSKVYFYSFYSIFNEDFEIDSVDVRKNFNFY